MYTANVDLASPAFQALVDVSILTRRFIEIWWVRF